MKDIKSLTDKEIIRCKTQEECDIILDMMHEAGLRRFTGITYKQHRPCYDLPNQGYRPFLGTRGNLNKYKEDGYTIYKASEFIKSNKKLIYLVFKTIQGEK